MSYQGELPRKPDYETLKSYEINMKRRFYDQLSFALDYWMYGNKEIQVARFERLMAELDSITNFDK